jgi:hypothetical protein
MPIDLYRPAAASRDVPPAAEIVPSRGTRRRRLRALAPHAHRPVIGACVPMPVLRPVVDKVPGGEVHDDDPVRGGAIAAGRQRIAMAGALRRDGRSGRSGLQRALLGPVLAPEARA